jgi:hypothetical protein
MAQKTLGGAAGDFLVHMESPQRCLTYGQITAPGSGGAFTLTAAKVVAFPLLANNVLAKAGDEASVVAFLIAGEAATLANSASTTGPLYTILSGFDGVVLNEDKLPTTDVAASPGTFNKTNLKAALVTLGVKWVDEADQQETQTT